MRKMLTKKEKFIKWLKMFKIFKGFRGKYYWLFKYRPGNYPTWRKFKDALL